MISFINLFLAPAISMQLLQPNNESNLPAFLIKYASLISFNFLIGQIITFLIHVILNINIHIYDEVYIVVAIFSSIILATLFKSYEFNISIEVNKREK